MLPTNAVSKRCGFLAVPHPQWHSIGNQKGGECGGVTNESALSFTSAWGSYERSVYVFYFVWLHKVSSHLKLRVFSGD